MRNRFSDDDDVLRDWHYWKVVRKLGHNTQRLTIPPKAASSCVENIKLGDNTQ